MCECVCVCVKGYIFTPHEGGVKLLFRICNIYTESVKKDFIHIKITLNRWKATKQEEEKSIDLTPSSLT